MGLITSQQVIDNTPMGGNVDEDKYMYLLNDVQNLVLEPVLGTKLYDKIVTDYNEGGANNLSGNYLKMYNEYIQQILWHSVTGEYAKLGFILIRNGGIYRHQPEDAQQADVDDIEYLSKNQKGKADSYIGRLETFLNDQDITEYDNPQDEDYDIDPTNVNTISGWWFGND